jgi:hypothetical protein
MATHQMHPRLPGLIQVPHFLLWQEVQSKRQTPDPYTNRSCQ